jgi:TLD
VSCGS